MPARPNQLKNMQNLNDHSAELLVDRVLTRHLKDGANAPMARGFTRLVSLSCSWPPEQPFRVPRL